MNEKAKILAEEVLLLMAYGIDLFMFPTFRNWDQSYEGWLYKNGLLNRLHYLEKRKWLLREGKHKEWVYRLTDEGRAVALGERDPEERWRRKWDGWWRQFIFDLPVGQQKARVSLIRWLRQHGFGYLQDSVWIAPDPIPDLAECLNSFRDDAESFTILESRCAKGFSNSSLVKGAWPCEEIDRCYREYQQFATAGIKRLRKEKWHPQELFGLLRTERKTWAAAFDLDPLLPMELWPSQYEGQHAWQSRQELLHLAAAQVPKH